MDFRLEDEVHYKQVMKKLGQMVTVHKTVQSKYLYETRKNESRTLSYCHTHTQTNTHAYTHILVLQKLHRVKSLCFLVSANVNVTR